MGLLHVNIFIISFEPHAVLLAEGRFRNPHQILLAPSESRVEGVL